MILVYKNLVMIITILKKLLNVGDQMLLTFWSFLLTVLLSRYFSINDFYLYSMFFTIQAIFILIINSSIGQLFLLEGKIYALKSIIKSVLIVSILCFSIILVILLLDLINLQTNFINLFLISLSVALFSLFELIRRYLYSLNYFKYSLKYTFLLILSFVFGIIIFYFLNLLNFRNLLCLNIAIYTIFNIIVIKSLHPDEDDANKNLLSLREVFYFNRWLLPGIFAYVVTNQFFIIYLSNAGSKLDVINLRLTETVFGLILVFVAAFENYFIATIKELDFKSVLYKMLPAWIIFLIIPIFISFVFNKLFAILFNSTFVFSNVLILLILVFYLLSIISRVFVVYLRVNKENKLIFYGNIFNSVVIIGVLFYKIDLNLQSIFILKTIFIIFNLLIYVSPKIKLCLKKLS